MTNTFDTVNPATDEITETYARMTDATPIGGAKNSCYGGYGLRKFGNTKAVAVMLMA